jgi:hypothetical protein
MVLVEGHHPHPGCAVSGVAAGMKPIRPDTLALNDFDRDFLRSVAIQIPEDSRWELDGDAVSEAGGDAVE